MIVKSLRGAAGVMLLAACATSGGLRGEVAGPVVDVTTVGRMTGGTATLTLCFSNHGADPLAIEIAEVRLRDTKGVRYEPLGRPQTFVEEGVRVTRRVAQRSLDVAPGEKREVALEWRRVPRDATGMSIVVPTLYRLTIGGQIEMKPLRVSLREEGASAPVPDGGFYDPFEQ